MPELRSPYGYPAVMLGMTGLAGGLLLIFWRLGWLGVRRSGPTALSGQAREQTPPKDR